MPSFTAGTSKNKIIDHRVKETCAIMLTQATYETDHIALLRHSTISSALNFCLFLVFLYPNEKHHRGKIDSKKKKCLYMKYVLLLKNKKLSCLRLTPYNLRRQHEFRV